MTPSPQEKAAELVKKWLSTRMAIYTRMHSIPTVVSDFPTLETAKQCALIEVNELIKEHIWSNPINWNLKRKQYWQEVRAEIPNVKL